MERGRVFWVTGLSGAGKTTIGRCLFTKMREYKSSVVFFDGDELRKVFGDDLGYTRDERFKCAMRYARLCKMISEQGVDVICCTISMFHDVRKWNRQSISNYVEIFVDVPMEIIKERNQKKLYSGVSNGTVSNVVGMDIEIELPRNPDMLIENSGNQAPDELADEIIKNFKLDIGD